MNKKETADKIIKVIKSCKTRKHMYGAMKFASIIIHRWEGPNGKYYLYSYYFKPLMEPLKQRIHEINNNRNLLRLNKFKKLRYSEFDSVNEKDY